MAMFVVGTFVIVDTTPASLAALASRGVVVVSEAMVTDACKVRPATDVTESTLTVEVTVDKTTAGATMVGAPEESMPTAGVGASTAEAVTELMPEAEGASAADEVAESMLTVIVGA